MYLLEANVGGVLAEALAADVQAILADDGCVCETEQGGTTSEERLAMCKGWKHAPTSI